MSEKNQSKSMYSEGVKDVGNLVVRPLGTNPERIASHLGQLEKLTGLDKFNLRQKFLGFGMQILDRSPDLMLVAGRSEALAEFGYPAAFFLTSEVKDIPIAFRGAGIKIRDNSITFVNIDNKKVFTINHGDKILAVLGSLGSGRFDVGSIITKAGPNLNEERLFPANRLQNICTENAFLDIYNATEKKRIRIIAERFNFKGFKDELDLSRVQNMIKLVKKVHDISGVFDLDLEFGSLHTPRVLCRTPDGPEARFLHFPAGDREMEFESYSRHIAAAWTAGLFDVGRIENKWPLDSLPRTKLPNEPESEIKQVRSEDDKVHDLVGDEAHHESFFEKISVAIDALGPKPIFVPMLLALPLDLLLLTTLKMPFFIVAGCGLMGLILFSHGFVILNRKRTIENIPTSRIRSMQMGRVEVAGMARQKYRLKTPYSNLDCVYYRYVVIDKPDLTTNYSTTALVVSPGIRFLAGTQLLNRSRNKVIARGDSGKIPFYIEDDTGRVLIEPAGAQVIVTNTNTMNNAMTGALPMLGGGRYKIVENYIPVGYHIYVHGHADRRVAAVNTRRKKTLAKLKELKADQSKLMAYDTDNSGHIDDEEWQRARADIEREVIAEELNEKVTNEVAITRKSSRDLFIISDQKEEKLVAGLNYRIIGSVALSMLFLGAAIFLALGYGSNLFIRG
jgi:E3 Ubiquitin ligase